MEKGIDFFDCVLGEFDLPKQDVRSCPPLTLAYIGDAIYELVIRSMVVASHHTQVNKLHKKSSDLVKAGTQAKMIAGLYDLLTEEERAVYKRGRNAKSHTAAKNADIQDYRRATGFEALMGMLYMTGQTGRMMELIKKGLDMQEK